MEVFTPLFKAAVGNTILLKTTPKGNVISYFATLERIGGGGGNQDQWDAATLETTGGRSTAIKGVNGYNVVIFPDMGDGGSIEVTLTVGAKTAPATVKNSGSSAGWRIFVF